MSWNDGLPELDECRYLILKIIEQAVRDYISLEDSSAPIDQYFYNTAYRFLFDDRYKIVTIPEPSGTANPEEYVEE